MLQYLVEGANPMYKDYAGNEKIYKMLKLPKEYDVGFVGARVMELEESILNI
ncbi:MAG: hypothetical protein U5K55_01485 [Aliarcobacter sp.]|nr:hypothetical protein [Aliarcobacter sp.]